jgi:hypothetical protein
MAEYLPFWPKSAAGAHVGATSTAYVYSKALPTNGFTEVVIELEVDADFSSDPDSYVQVTPQISNDGVNWEDQTSASFHVHAGGTFPAQVTEKFTEIGAFMRMKVHLYNDTGGAVTMAPTIMIAATGRS